jgi:hypothetical protein
MVVMLAMALWALALAGTARASLPASSFQHLLNATSYSWSLTGVPDIDQVRGTDATHPGLPNDGKMYCVVTAGMDLLTYLANNGFATGVAAKDWTLPGNYNEMTADLAALGSEMGADPAKGTSGTGFVNAMGARLASAGIGSTDPHPGVAQLVYYTSDPNFQGPSAQAMALDGLGGSLVAPVIGFYSDEQDSRPGAPPGAIVKRRVGGHVMAAVGASGNLFSPNAEIDVRDPATDYVVKDTQTPYATDPHALAPLTANYIWTDSANQNHYNDGVANATWDGSTTTLFDGYLRIVPASAWGLIGSQLVLLRPYQLIPDPGPVVERFKVPGGRAPLALSLSAITNRPAFLVPGSSTVWSLDPVTRRFAELGRVAHPTALTFGGPEQALYVAGAGRLVKLGARGRVLSSRRLSAPISALAFDSARGHVVGVSTHRLELFDRGLHPVGSSRLPAAALAGAGRVSLALGPGGALLLGRAGQRSFTTTRPGAQTAAAAGAPVRLVRRSVPGGQPLTGLTVDDSGRALVSAGGRLRVFDRAGRLVPRSRFAGRLDRVFAFTRSFSNVPPEVTRSLDFLPRPDPQRPAPPPPPGAQPPPPTPKPDLVVVRTGPRQIAVRNQGAAAAGASILAVTNPGQSFSVPSLAPGAQSPSYVAACGATRTATADANNQVEESDETNNSIPLTC